MRRLMTRSNERMAARERARDCSGVISTGFHCMHQLRLSRHRIRPRLLCTLQNTLSSLQRHRPLDRTLRRSRTRQMAMDMNGWGRVGEDQLQSQTRLNRVASRSVPPFASPAESDPTPRCITIGHSIALCRRISSRLHHRHCSLSLFLRWATTSTTLAFRVPPLQASLAPPRPVHPSMLPSDHHHRRVRQRICPKRRPSRLPLRRE